MVSDDPKEAAKRMEVFQNACDSLFDESSTRKLFEVNEKLRQNFRSIAPIPNVIFRTLKFTSQARGAFYKLSADLICRSDPSMIPSFPQKFVYFPRCTDGAYSQTSAFNLSTFFFHYGESLVHKCHEANHEFSLTVENAGKKHSVQVDNGGAVIFEENCDGLEEEIMRFSNPLYLDVDGEPSTSVELPIAIRSDNVYLESASLVSKITRRIVPIMMNGRITKEIIKKAEIFEKNERTEVILLFNSYFIATGTIEEVDGETTCVVSELSGTYGTTDFQCSPACTSMVRTCNPIARNKTSNASTKESIEIHRRRLRKAVRAVKYYMEKETYCNVIQENDYIIRSLCSNVRMLNRLMENFDDQQFHPDSLDSSWTPREKLIFLIHKHSSIDVDEEKDEFEDDTACLKRFRRNVAVYSQPDVAKPLGGEVLLELLLQLSLASLAIRVVLSSPSSTFTRKSVNALLLLSNFKYLYEWNLTNIAAVFDILITPEMRLAALESMAARATPSDCSTILKLYELAPESVQSVLQRHPYLILSGVSPICPPLPFLRDFSIWLDQETKSFNAEEMYDQLRQINNSETLSVVSSDPTLSRKTTMSDTALDSPEAEVSGPTTKGPSLESFGRGRLNCRFWDDILKSPDTHELSESPPRLQIDESAYQNETIVSNIELRKSNLRDGPALLDYVFRNSKPK